VTTGNSPRTTLRGGLAPDVRPGRCAYCGRPCNGRTCAGHADLPAIEAAVDRSVETVDSPNGLRSDQGSALDRPEAQGIASTPVEQR